MRRREAQERRLLPRPPAPFIRAPFEAAVIDHLARPESRPAAESARPGPEPRSRRRCDTCRARRRAPGIVSSYQPSASACIGCARSSIKSTRLPPEPRCGRSRRLVQFGAKAHACHHAAPENTRTERGCAAASRRRRSSPSRGLRAVSSTARSNGCISGGRAA